jgi:ribosome-associated translation inhibitor RaiA
MTRFQINIKATNLELNDELRNLINEKVSTIEKFMSLKGDQEALVDVEISKDFGNHHQKGEIYRAEINFPSPNNKSKICRVDKRGYDIQSALERSVQDAKREARRNRERKIDLFRRGAKDLKKLLKFGKK